MQWSTFILILHGGEAVILFLMIIGAVLGLSVLFGFAVYKLVNRISKTKKQQL